MPLDSLDFLSSPVELLAFFMFTSSGYRESLVTGRWLGGESLLTIFAMTFV